MNIDVTLQEVPVDVRRVRAYLASTLSEALGAEAVRFERVEVQVRRCGAALECALRLYARHADVSIQVESRAPRLHAALEGASWRAWEVLRAVARAGAVAA